MEINNPKFSLIMGTLGRSDEIGLFVNSLLKQTNAPSWELIIVDQNNDNRVAEVLLPFSSRLPSPDSLKLIKTQNKGLSIARNIGLTVARGELIAFPDDDCMYSPQILKFVSDNFEEDAALDGLTLFDVNNCHSLTDQRNVGESYLLNDYNIFQRAISYTIFLRHVSAQHRFDERFGVGATYGATEETDYLFRLLGKGAILKQIGGPVIFHPDKTMDYENVSRAYSYNIGVGAFFSKHLSLKRPYIIVFFFISWCKLFIRLFQKSILFWSIDRRWYFAIAKGRFAGMLLFHNNKGGSWRNS